MSVLETIRTMTKRATDRGQAQAEDLRRRRRRNDLIRQLGEVAYRQAKDPSQASGEVDRLVAAIDQVDGGHDNSGADGNSVDNGADEVSTDPEDDATTTG